eukprot:7769028-Pyramimonas_sp.AAC.1
MYGVNQEPVQLYDTRYTVRAGDAYKEFKMRLKDWDILHQGVGVMQPVAELTTHLETTLTPVVGQVLPYVNRVMNRLHPTREVKVLGVRKRNDDLEEEVQAGRQNVLDDMHQRWVTDLQSNEMEMVQTHAGKRR